MQVVAWGELGTGGARTSTVGALELGLDSLDTVRTATPSSAKLTVSVVTLPGRPPPTSRRAAACEIMNSWRSSC
jgi:hypothetical protein